MATNRIETLDPALIRPGKWQIIVIANVTLSQFNLNIISSAKYLWGYIEL